MNITKTEVSLSQVKQTCEKINKTFSENSENEKYKLLLASILTRRNVTKGDDLLYYLEDNLSFEHNPFCFNQMEDAVERILAAREEEEKVLIFGDRDVDGVTSTAILFQQLKKMNMDVSYRLPVDEEAYGLSMEAVDDFAAQNGTLIITVDCGISNAPEIEYAASLGIDVIVTDHHNPPETVPDAIAILDPKTEDSGYPFPDISGAAVSYKLVSALKFSQSDFYGSEVCILYVTDTPDESGNYEITCTKLRNLTKYKEIKEIIRPGITHISDTKLPYFLSGQYIYVWDNKTTSIILKELFGSGIDFNFLDLRAEISKIWKNFATLNASDLLNVSKTAKYRDEKPSVPECLFNVFVLWANTLFSQKNKLYEADREKMIQLVGIAALADIMPLKNENRLFVRNCMESIKKIGPIPGLAELFAKMGIDYHYLTGKDLGWSVIPALNASGRMGQSNLSLELLIDENPANRDATASKIIELNEMRKNLVNEASIKTSGQINESLNRFNNKICIIFHEEIHKGITGILANKIMGSIKVPTLALTEFDGKYSGSMRSCRGVIATDFLKTFGDFFIAYGGHNAAAGFSFEKEQLNEFYRRAQIISESIELEDDDAAIKIDAEIPPAFLSPDLLKVIDLLEPYGNENEELVLYSSKLVIADAQVVGKKEPFHLKLTFDCGKYKFPAMLWSGADRLNRDFYIKDQVNVLYSINKNIFNGNITPQMIIKDIEKV